MITNIVHCLYKGSNPVFQGTSEDCVRKLEAIKNESPAWSIQRNGYEIKPVQDNTFETLDELYTAAGHHELSVQEILRGRGTLKDGYQEIKITEALKEEIIKQMLLLMGGLYRTKAIIRHVLLHQRVNHAALERFVIMKYKHTPKAYINYLAYQDQYNEMVTLRNDLKSKFR